MTTSDERRGIQNTYERVSELPTRTSTGDRILREKYARVTGADESEAVREQEEYLREVERQEEAFAEEEAHARAVEQMQAQIEIARQLLKHARGGASFAKKNLKIATRIASLLWISFWVAIIAYLWQLLFAIGALVGFGIHGGILYVRHETLVGKVLGWFADFEKLSPFEGLGYVFWGLGFLLVTLQFIYFFILLRVCGYKPFGSSTMFLVTAVCLGFSIFPATNLFPWLILWIFSVMLFSRTT